MDLQQINTDTAIRAARERIAHTGRLLFDRHLTDAAGGNISERVGDLICMSPSYSGANHQWQIDPDDVLVIDFDRNILSGKGAITREAHVHLRLHRDFGAYGTGVIHAHPRNLLVFAAMNKELPPVLEATRKFGVTPVVPYAPAHSNDLADSIAETMKGREQLIQKHAAATIAPWHGVFLIAKTLYAAFDAVERLDTNAYIMMMGQHLGASPMFTDERAEMETAIGAYGEE